MRGTLSALAGVVMAALVQPALAATTVNINTTSSSETARAIVAVDIRGFGSSSDATFPDHRTAPTTDNAAVALEVARVSLGLPDGTTFANLSFDRFGDIVEQFTTVTSNFNPVDDPTFVIGDPDDYFTWIAVGAEDVNVNVFQVERTTETYKLFADPVSTAVPVPASGLLLLAGVVALPLMRRRMRA